MAFVILTSKHGEFRTEVGTDLTPMETYDYTCFGRPKARFIIARLDAPTRVRIVDETPPRVVNLIPSKFLPRFESVEKARRELEELAHAGGEFVLKRVE